MYVNLFFFYLYLLLADALAELFRI